MLTGIFLCVIITSELRKCLSETPPNDIFVKHQGMTSLLASKGGGEKRQDFLFKEENKRRRTKMQLLMSKKANMVNTVNAYGFNNKPVYPCAFFAPAVATTGKDYGCDDRMRNRRLRMS